MPKLSMIEEDPAFRELSHDGKRAFMQAAAKSVRQRSIFETDPPPKPAAKPGSLRSVATATVGGFVDTLAASPTGMIATAQRDRVASDMAAGKPKTVGQRLDESRARRIDYPAIEANPAPTPMGLAAGLVTAPFVGFNGARKGFEQNFVSGSKGLSEFLGSEGAAEGLGAAAGSLAAMPFDVVGNAAFGVAGKGLMAAARVAPKVARAVSPPALARPRVAAEAVPPPKAAPRTIDGYPVPPEIDSPTAPKPFDPSEEIARLDEEIRVKLGSVPAAELQAMSDRLVQIKRPVTDPAPKSETPPPPPEGPAVPGFDRARYDALIAKKMDWQPLTDAERMELVDLAYKRPPEPETPPPPFSVEPPAPTAPAGPPKPWQMRRADFEATGEDFMHGTSRNFERFSAKDQTNRYGAKGADERGRFYFTDKSDVADEFANASGYRQVDLESWLDAGNDRGDSFGEAAARLLAAVQGQVKDGKRLMMRDWDRSGDLIEVAPDDPRLLNELIEGGDVRIYYPNMAPRIIKTKVYGRTLDLSDPAKIPQDLSDELRAKNDPYNPTERMPNFRHEHSRVLYDYARRHGYGKIKVRDSHESGYQSVIGLEEFIGHNADPHRAAIERAIAEGQPVPPEVLADYPDLAPAPKPRTIGGLPARRGSIQIGGPESEGPKPSVIKGKITRARTAHDAYLAAGNTAKAGEMAAEIQRLEASLPGGGPKPVMRDPAGVVASDHANFPRFDGSPGQTLKYQEFIQDSVSRMATDPREPWTQKMVLDEAGALHPSLIHDIAKKGLARGETIHPAVRQRMRDEVKTLARLADDKENEIQAILRGPQTDETLARAHQLGEEMEQHHADARAYTDILIPARSQDGRNLAFHAMTAREGFEPEYWLAKARKLASGDASVPLPKATEARIAKVLAKGEKAKTRLEEIAAELEARGITDHGVTTEGRMIPPEVADGGILQRIFYGLKGLFTPKARRGSIGVSAKPDPESWVTRFKRWWEAGKPGAKKRAEEPLHSDPVIDALLREARQEAHALAEAKAARADELAALQQTPMATFLSAVMKANMLTGVGTGEMQIIGPAASLPFEGATHAAGAPVDFAMSLFTGIRTLSTPHPKDVWAASKVAAVKGTKEAKQIWRHGATLEQLARLDASKELNVRFPWVGRTLNRALNGYVNHVFRALAIPDRYARAFALDASLRAQARTFAKAYAKAHPGVSAKQHAEYLYQDIVDGRHPNATSAIITAQAIQDAEEATFTNKTLIGDIANQVGRGPQNKKFDAVRPMWGAAVDTIMPLKQIPSAQTQRTIDASGLGLVARAAGHVGSGDTLRMLKEGMTYEEQRGIAKAVGRGATGAAFMTAGYYLGQAGLVSGLYDPNMKETYEASGKLPGSVYLGGRWVPLATLGPPGVLLAVGATMEGGLKDAKKLPGAVLKGVTAGPLTQGIDTMVKAVDNPGGEAAKLAASVAGRTVPGYVGDLAAVLDDRKVQPEIPRDFPANAIAGVQSRIPGMRSKMPGRPDALGRPVEGKGDWSALWRLTGKADRTSPMLAEFEAKRVNLPKVPVIGKNLTHDGRSLVVTRENRQAYLDEFREQVEKRTARLMARRSYRESRNELAQRQELNRVVGEAKGRAMAKLFARSRDDTRIPRLRLSDPPPALPGVMP